MVLPEVLAPQPSVFTPTAFEELRQEVVTLNQLLGRQNLPLVLTPELNDIIKARPRSLHPESNNGGVGSLGTPRPLFMTWAITMIPKELMKIIQGGITIGLRWRTQGLTSFNMSTHFNPRDYVISAAK